MKSVIAYRNGVEKIRVMAEVRNGVLRSGKNILINNDLIKAPHTPARVCAAIKAGKITPEIEAMGMRIGDNGNGLVVRWAADVDAEDRAKAQAEYEALPADVRAAQEERAAIDRLFAAAWKSENQDTDDMQMDRAMRQRSEANRRLAAWKTKYQTAAENEKKKDLMAQAEKLDELAVGALVYDCDGSLTPEMQQQRHDEFKSRAAELRKQAM